jgi:hypothetical protein
MAAVTSNAVAAATLVAGQHALPVPPYGAAEFRPPQCLEPTISIGSLCDPNEIVGHQTHCRLTPATCGQTGH